MLKPRKIMSLITALIALALLPGAASFAEEGATTDDVYNLILKAVPVIQELGQEGLEAFKDPKGEFVVKDAYVLVIDCSTMTMVAHPNPKLVGMNLSESKDKNPDPAKVKYHGREMCELSKKPNGGWLEYYWDKMGSDQIARKVGFVIGEPGTGYALISSIYDETSNVDELNASLK